MQENPLAVNGETYHAGDVVVDERLTVPDMVITSITPETVTVAKPKVVITDADDRHLQKREYGRQTFENLLQNHGGKLDDRF